MTTDDSSELGLLRARDQAAWADFYDQHAADVRAFIRRIGGKDPDDLLGETMMQVVRDIGQFSGTSSDLRAWVFGIARNRVIDDGRRRKVRPIEVEQGDSDPAVTGEFEMPDLATLSSLLDALTTEQKEVVWLRFGADLSVEETAKVVGKNPDAVAALTMRALKRLRALASR
jgi:RNA polymerase sigma-70 factor (ECF subfamily)